MFRGSERIRLITMLGTLCILGMIIYSSLNSRGRQPAADGSDAERVQADAEKPNTAAKPPEIETVVPGPTDEDPDEAAEAESEFQILTDGTLGIGKLEMPAYRRVFGWVEHQSFADLKRRAEKNVPLDGLIRTPDEFRGKLLQIDLNVRQAIPVDGAPLGVKTVYELRGFSEDSGAWLYFAIVPELPEDMASGSNIEERLRVVGYFFKLHGYLEAGAKPRSAPLKAPLLIGRVERRAASASKTTATDKNWLYYAAAIFVLVGFFFSLAQFFSRRSARHHRTQLDQYKRQRNQTSSSQDESSDDDEPVTGDLPSTNDEGFDFRKPS
jgi:hypothetical protein